MRQTERHTRRRRRPTEKSSQVETEEENRGQRLSISVWTAIQDLRAKKRERDRPTLFFVYHLSLILDCLTLFHVLMKVVLCLPSGSGEQQLSRCPHCGKLFRGPRSTASLEEHITNIHAVVAPSSSSVNSIPSPSSLLHVVPSSGIIASDLHLSDSSFPCYKCKVSFSHKDLLEKHVMLCHSILHQVSKKT